MARLEIEQIPVMRDNYVYLVHDGATGATAAIDPGTAEPVLDRLSARGWRLSYVLNTHHHDDHTGANLTLKARTGCKVAGYGPDAQRLPGIDIELADGDEFRLGDAVAKVIAVPGHTSGHIAFWFADQAALFPGDTLFAMGCGRLFEGSPEQMWNSLCKLRALPGDALVYCAHEYTASNARFAETVERDNQAMIRRIGAIAETRSRDEPTVPSRLDLERATNPFLRADEPSVKAALGMTGVPDAQVFAEIRHRKDSF